MTEQRTMRKMTGSCPGETYRVSGHGHLDITCANDDRWLACVFEKISSQLEKK